MYGYIGKAWNQSNVDMEAQYLVDYVYNCYQRGGALFLNVGLTGSEIAEEQREVLRRVKAAVRDNEGEFYTLINNAELTDDQIKTTGTWVKRDNLRKGQWANQSYNWYQKYSPIQYDAFTSNDSGARLDFYFKGTGVAYIGERGPNYGQVDVYIDDFYRSTVNCYAAEGSEEYVQYLYTEQGLTDGVHKLSLVAKEGELGGRQLFVDALGVSNYRTVTQAEREALDKQLADFTVTPNPPLLNTTVPTAPSGSTTPTSSPTKAPTVPDQKPSDISPGFDVEEPEEGEPATGLDAQALQERIEQTEGNLVAIKTQEVLVFTPDMLQLLKDAGKGVRVQRVNEMDEIQEVWTLAAVENTDIEWSLSVGDECAAAITALTGDAKTQAVCLGQGGALPGEVSLILRNTAAFVVGEPIYLYAYDPERGTLDMVNDQVAVSNDTQFISLVLTQGGHYAASNYGVAESVDNPAPDVQEQEPEENGFPWWIILIVIAAVVVVAGATVTGIIVYRKRAGA